MKKYIITQERLTTIKELLGQVPAKFSFDIIAMLLNLEEIKEPKEPVKSTLNSKSKVKKSLK